MNDVSAKILCKIDAEPSPFLATTVDAVEIPEACLSDPLWGDRVGSAGCSPSRVAMNAADLS